MKRLGFCVALTLLGCQHPGTAGTTGATAPASAPATLRNDDEKTLYALGLLLGQRLEDFALTPAELAIVQRGVNDQVGHVTPAVTLAQFGPKIGDLARARQTVRAAAEHTRGEAFATTAAAEPGAVKLPSGLVYRELTAGTGAQPAASDRVRVNYRGTLIDGTEFDSSYARHEPAEFGLGGVIPCWTEGVQRMKVGGKAKLVCPASIAYGDRGQRNIPAGATLVFEIELLAILPAAEVPAAGAPPTGMMGGPGGMMGGPGGMHMMGGPGGIRMMPAAPGAPPPTGSAAGTAPGMHAIPANGGHPTALPITPANH